MKIFIFGETYGKTENIAAPKLSIAIKLIQVKGVEQEYELPFKKLVMSQLNIVDTIESRELIEKAIVWWKVKNKWKRAISVDTAKALRMIIKYLERKENVRINV